MRKVYLIFALVFILAAAPVFAADITGKWELKFTGPMGPETWNLAVTMTGENTFSAKGNHPNLGSYDGKGTLDGNNIKIVFVLQGGQYTRIIEGTLEENNTKAKGKVTRGDQGGKFESDFTLVKK